MIGMIDHILTQEGYDIPTTTDAHGDQVAGTPVAMLCRFRYVTGIEKGQNVESLAGIDAIIWRKPDANIVEGSIMQVDGSYWRVDRLIKARRLAGSAVMFLKAYVQKHSM